MSNDDRATDAIAPRSDVDYAIEFGRYLATAAEAFMAEQNRAAAADETPDSDIWRSLESAVYEFRKRADRADRTALDQLHYPGECAEWLMKRRGITFAEGLALAEKWIETDA